MNKLMANLGKSFGNVLAQQYGVNSECLDITSDPSVAAFLQHINILITKMLQKLMIWG